MPARTRPIEKFARAVAQCSVEVSSPKHPRRAVSRLIDGTVLRIREMHCRQLQWRSQGYVSERVFEAEGMLFGKWPISDVRLEGL